MKSKIAIFIIGMVLGTAGGGAGMLIAFPFLFPPPQAHEQVADIAGTAMTPFAQSHFREEVAGQDFAHWARGKVKFYRDQNDHVLMELQTDFEAAPGPDYWIYLNHHQPINQEQEFLADPKRIKLTQLRSFKGSQVYRIDKAQFSHAKAVTIWCESFGEYIASANLP